MKIQSAHRRRTSRAPLLLGLLLLALIGLLWWLASRDTQVPLTQIEIDVTNAAAAK
jgi:hypothetical protein